MNVKIGELVEYVEDLKRSHERKVEGLRDTIDELVRIKSENKEELDVRDQLIHQLEEKVKVAEENAASCLKSFKEMETLWGERDQNIMYWFKANNLSEDRANDLMKFLLKYQEE